MDWKDLNNQLTGQFTFKNFREAWSFMTNVALVAESINHHPNWSNTYNKVTIQLSTHDAGNIITEKDRKLAKLISDIYIKYS